MLNYGVKAKKLLEDLNLDNNELLPMYKQDLINQIYLEMQELYNENQKDGFSASSDQEKQDLFPVIKIRHTALLWNKRCLLAYHYHRLLNLKKIRWQLGSVLPDEIRKNLSNYEIQWFLFYCENIANYMSKLNNDQGLDLTMYKNPPKSLYIQVKCLVDFGYFEIDDGTKVFLTKGSMHYLPLHQCEKLLRQGILEQINN